MRAAHLNALQSLLARDAQAGALHARHLLLLGAICAHGRPLPLNAAADLIGLSYEQSTRLVRRLIDAGLLERQLDRDDARRFFITPTRQGRVLDERVRGYVAACAAANSQHTTEEVA